MELNYKFELRDGCYSVSDISDYLNFIIKNHEITTMIPPIHIYIVLKIKDRVTELIMD